MTICAQDLENWFTHHPPQGDQVERYVRIRSAALEFAKVVVENTPACEDQDFMMKQFRAVVMMANAAIACNEE